jgi:uncharacterized protein YfaS (alpha-2-macroglobulin family)
VLVLDYMRRQKQITPEIEAKALTYVNEGYQRLLTFEIRGGGFEWFGRPPAHVILSAYGLMEFHEMAKVYDVDPAVLERTRRWLLSKQEADGSWAPPERVIDTVARKFRRDVLRNTAYVAWALATTGFQGKELDQATSYMKGHLREEMDTYTVALVANAFLSRDRKDGVGLSLLQTLAERARVEKDTAMWTQEGTTALHGGGRAAEVETTALAILAFRKAGNRPDLMKKALSYLVSAKDSFGTYHSTQATILAMKALLSATGAPLADETGADIRVLVNGDEAGRVKITPETSDVMRLVSLKEKLRTGGNRIELEIRGKSSAAYQLVSRHYIPWPAEAVEKKEPLRIEVRYDKRTIALDDRLRCDVRVTNTTAQAAAMVIVDLGIPPGFDVDPSGFESLRGRGKIERYSLTGNQVILYFRRIAGGEVIEFPFTLKARYPIRARTPASKVYMYYDPERRGVSEPVDLVVRGK